MSFISETVYSFEAVWAKISAFARALRTQERRIKNLEGRLANLVAQIGDVMLAPYTYPPPDYFVRIEKLLVTGVYGARRMLNTSTGLAFEDVPEGEEPAIYEVHTMPGCEAVFIGARCWVQHTHNQSSANPATAGRKTAIYATKSGECCGFRAVVNGEPSTLMGGDVVYPWAQTGVRDGDAYTDETVIMFDGVSTPLGKAHLVTQAGWDESNPVFRETLPVGAPVFIWYDVIAGRFVMMQAVEVQMELCPS